MSAGIKANVDGSAAIQVGGTDVITLTSGGAATFVTSPTTVQAGTAAAPSITTSGDTNTGIFFPAADTIAFAEGGAEALRINSSGTVVLSGGDTSANGTGITFPATQSASSNANTLDDYEEGTFSPTFAGGTFTYAVQTGIYTKIGNIVNVQIFISTNSRSGSGTVTIAGLPFAPNIRTAVTIYGDSWITTPYGARIDAATTAVNLYKSSNGTSPAQVSDMENLSGGYNQTYINVTYRI